MGFEVHGHHSGVRRRRFRVADGHQSALASHPIEDTSDDDARRVVYCKVPAFRLDIREVENLGEGIGSDVPNAGLVLGVPVVADVEDGGLDGGYGFEVFGLFALLVLFFAVLCLEGITRVCFDLLLDDIGGMGTGLLQYGDFIHR